jgi:nucleoside phosphorylase
MPSIQTKEATTSLNIMLALSCEAKPIVDFYRLKKLHSKGFDHFYSDANANRRYAINLVVSGIGSANMLQASAWIAAKTELMSCAWLNVGTAGHETLDLGVIVQVVHCVEPGSSKAHYPPLVVNTRKASKGTKSSSEGVSLLSNNTPVSDYPVNQAVDMEAYSFFVSAKRFASSELIQSLKVISDNQNHALELLNAVRISELLASQINIIDEFSRSLVALVPLPKKQYLRGPEISHLHFTVSQMAQYQDFMNKLDNIHLDRSKIDAALAGASSMREVLTQLKTLQLTVAPALAAVSA